MKGCREVKAEPTPYSKKKRNFPRRGESYPVGNRNAAHPGYCTAEFLAQNRSETSNGASTTPIDPSIMSWSNQAAQSTSKPGGKWRKEGGQPEFQLKLPNLFEPPPPIPAQLMKPECARPPPAFSGREHFIQGPPLLIMAQPAYTGREGIRFPPPSLHDFSQPPPPYPRK